MVHSSEDTVAFRLWPPVAIGALLVGWLATPLWGDPVDLSGWRVPVGWVLVLLFVGWNGWSLWLFSRHETGLLPGQATHAMIEEGPYRLSRNPLHVGPLALYLGLALLAPTFWELVLFPVVMLLLLLGGDPARGAVPARAVRCAVRRLHAAGASLAVNTHRLATGIARGCPDLPLPGRSASGGMTQGHCRGSCCSPDGPPVECCGGVGRL